MSTRPVQKIKYYRRGFATNSSSSHSVLLFEEDIKSLIQDYDPCNGGYGWEDFSLVSKESKIKYLKAQIASQWRNVTSLPEDYAGYYVDHQSDWGLIPIPNETGTEPHPKWFKIYEDWITNDKIVVYGGNDNSESSLTPPTNTNYNPVGAPNPKSKTRFSVAPYGQPVNYIGRYVEDADYFLMFDTISGTKIKVKFSEGELPNTSEYPELVDLKITDYCPFNCEYCYQGSTIKGKHAKLEAIKKTIDILAEAKTLEIAIGGGEPTLHPDFLKILRYAKEKGVVPNFTSKNYKILTNREAVETILECCGAFAFSVDSAEDVKQISYHQMFAANMLDIKLEQITQRTVIQHPVGSCSKEEFKEILNQIGTLEVSNVLTLLGHKTTGRGNKSLVKASNEDVLLTVRLHKIKIPQHNFFINVDTSFVKDQEKEIRTILGNNVYEATMSSKDGLTSVYVDAVEETISASSYEPERGHHNMKPLYGNLEEFLSTWKTIQKS